MILQGVKFSVVTRAALAMRTIGHHRVSVCLCVTRRYRIKTAKRKITQTTPRDSPGTLCFLMPNVVGGPTPLPPEICAESDLSKTSISTNMCS